VVRSCATDKTVNFRHLCLSLTLWFTKTYHALPKYTILRLAIRIKLFINVLTWQKRGYKLQTNRELNKVPHTRFFS